ncbi:MAG: DUF262 domain-containing protein [Sulfurovum sp.]|nr:DUF262 domain-containing protein [Sulfurovum sp.]
MALELTAEHQRILDIFSGKTQYVIPAYQRSYSWEEEQCMELLEDLKQAFVENQKEGYFLGNIVTAKNAEKPDVLEVIDGQQRLTTLTLLIRVLLSFDENNRDLQDAITIPAGRSSEASKPRLLTNSFIEKDAVNLEHALDLDFDDDNICDLKKKESRYKKNICYFYQEIKKIHNDNEINIFDFIDFLLFNVTLLPIQTKDNTPDSAREKALKIFETINNRGLSLADSDIFKAKLYALALSEKTADDFIKEWKELEEESKELDKPQGGKYSINDIFRFYSQIIRGQEGITKSEIGLREFFTQTPYSPFKTKTSEEILTNLFKIVSIIRFFRNIIERPNEYNELTKWFQLLAEYTNQYPLNTLVVYLYIHGTDMDREELTTFTKHLVRYAFSHGASSKVKFPLFSFISKIIKNQEKDFTLSFQEKTENDLQYFGQLKKGFTLLAFYLNPEQEAINPHYFNKIISSRDTKILNNTWNDIDLTYYDYSDTLGNMLITDINISRDVKLLKKEEYFKNSSIKEIQALATKLNNWSHEDYVARERLLQKRLKYFFEKIDEN